MKADLDIQFLSYTGKYPNLCTGVLTISIGGKKWQITPMAFTTKDRIEGLGYEDTGMGDWSIYPLELPEEIRKYADDIERIMNENVEHGCCGGCI
ncbi:hypothetical protein AGMMS49992_34280 [Clostridia bacterium]|nr:hypothetical protein AGMMS49992_34280 [Clostridia bacterium]